MSSNSNNRHEIVERNVGLLAILIVFAISLGALVEITPLIFQKQQLNLLKTYVLTQLLSLKVVTSTPVKVVTYVTAK